MPSILKSWALAVNECTAKGKGMEQALQLAAEHDLRPEPRQENAQVVLA